MSNLEPADDSRSVSTEQLLGLTFLWAGPTLAFAAAILLAGR